MLIFSFGNHPPLSWREKLHTTMRGFIRRLWACERGISSVEYALLLAFIGGGIIVAADELKNAVANWMEDTAALFAEDTCGNDGGGAGTGQGGGQGGGNTC